MIRCRGADEDIADFAIYVPPRSTERGNLEVAAERIMDGRGDARDAWRAHIGRGLHRPERRHGLLDEVLTMVSQWLPWSAIGQPWSPLA